MCILQTLVRLNKRVYQDIMNGHTKKVARMLSKEMDVDEHIQNISSYKLSFFQKLILCRGLKFSIPRPVSAKDIQVSFERAYRTLEVSGLPEDKKEITAATLRSIALNYIERRGPSPPKSLQRALNQLKQRDDIVITKPDEGTGVVVMNKGDYIRLLSEASIDDEDKFKLVNPDQPKMRGRPIKHYHPLLLKEKELEKTVREILLENEAVRVYEKGSRLAHLYGLSKTHKSKLSMRPILSAVGTYNYKLARWLDIALKPLSVNKSTISDPLKFAEKIRQTNITADDILVSYDVSSLFTNVPVDETIQLLADKAFKNNWFNEKNKLNIKKTDLIKLLTLATKHQLFQFNGKLYEQVDGVAMGSPLGPLMANAFMCSLEEKLSKSNNLPSFYNRYVDDTLTKQSSLESAESFLSILNNCHPSLSFTMEVEQEGKIPFLGMEITKKDGRLETKVYIKPTNTGLLLHYHSHVDKRYKRSLITTMLNRAYRLSSSWHHFSNECERLKTLFDRLKYPPRLVDSVISTFIDQQYKATNQDPESSKQKVLRIASPSKDQKSADDVKKQLANLSNVIGTKIQPVYTSRKIGKDLAVSEVKPPLVNKQNVVYKFECDLCDADYIGYTSRHLHQRIDEHRNSAIGRHVKEKHGEDAEKIVNCFSVLRKCQGKYDCLLYEMLYIKQHKPSLNTQSDSIQAKVFV